MAGIPAPQASMSAGAAVDKIPTGIDGLDRMIGGLAKGESILLIGDGGSGKTVFALQFAKSACSSGLRTIFITFGHGARELRQLARAAGWDPAVFEQQRLLCMIEHSQIEASRIELAGLKCPAPHKGNFTELMRYATPGTEVLIMDRLDEYAKGLSPAEFRDGFEYFVRRLRERGITALMLMDKAAPGVWKKLAMETLGGVIQFIRWENPRTGRGEMALDIVKMAGVQAPIGALAYDLSEGGFEVCRDKDRTYPNDSK